MMRSQGFFSISPLIGIALLGWATIAAAETIWPNAPKVTQIEVECYRVGNQRHTVRIQTSLQHPLYFLYYRATFRNVQNASAATLNLSPDPVKVDTDWLLQDQFFDIPVGVYDITIAQRYPEAGRGEVIVRNIKVPATVNSPRGRGCQFL